MQTTWKVTAADRDGQGKIRVDEPRSLADLLPAPDAIKQDSKHQTWTRQEVAGLAVVALIAAFVLVYAWSTPSAPVAQIERALVVQPTVPPARPTAPPTAAPARMLGAYAAPDGMLLGQIEETRPYTPTAHFGDAWVQADVAGSGLVWIRAADMPGMALSGPDLAPAPQPQIVYVNAPAPAQAPAQAAPTYSAPAAQPTPDWYTTPPVVQPEFQQALIGSDPNALACNGSPICGGLTNAQAQEALDRQRSGR